MVESGGFWNVFDEDVTLVSVAHVLSDLVGRSLDLTFLFVDVLLDHEGLTFNVLLHGDSINSFKGKFVGSEVDETLSGVLGRNFAGFDLSEFSEDCSKFIGCKVFW